MTASAKLRTHLVRVQSWPDAHASFDAAVARFPIRARGAVPKGLAYSAWQLVEHIRRAQADILEFCVSRNYTEKTWPAERFLAVAAGRPAFGSMSAGAPMTVLGDCPIAAL